MTLSVVKLQPARPTGSSASFNSRRSSSVWRLTFTTFAMNQSRSLGERMSRSIASSSAAEKAFGLHTKVARRRAAVSPVAQS